MVSHLSGSHFLTSGGFLLECDQIEVFHICWLEAFCDSLASSFGSNMSAYVNLAHTGVAYSAIE